MKLVSAVLFVLAVGVGASAPAFAGGVNCVPEHPVPACAQPPRGTGLPPVHFRGRVVFRSSAATSSTLASSPAPVTVGRVPFTG